MTTETISLDELQNRQFPNMTAVCSFGPRTLYSATRARQYWLLVINAPASVAIVCEYDDWKEWQNEMSVLRRAALGGSGEEGPPDIGVTADLPPSPPSMPASNAHALPVPSEIVPMH